MIAVTHEVREAVAWWLQTDNVLPGVPLNSNYLIQPQVLVFCDASQMGLGVICNIPKFKDIGLRKNKPFTSTSKRCWQLFLLWKHSKTGFISVQS
jgi:hypothetical protein